MNTTGKVAAAMAAGYLLGRTKKFRLAITVGGLLAGKRIATDPRELVQQALGVIENNPELSKLSDQIRSKLVDAGREAAVAAASSQLNRVSDSIRSRTDRLTGVPDVVGVASGSREDESEDRAEDSGGGEPSDSGEAHRSRLSRLRPHRRRDRGDRGSGRTDRESDSSVRGGRPTKKTAAKRPASAERSADSGRIAKKTASKRSDSGSTAKKAAAKKATAKKSTPPRKTTAKKAPAKKAAKKATSGSARKRG
jgi:hypothetical protein